MFLIGSESFWQAGADLDERMNIFLFLAARASGNGPDMNELQVSNP